MNKITSTKERIFISLVGPSGSGKSHLIFDWLKIGTFQPVFDKIFYFYQHYQPLYSQMQRKNLKFIQGVDFDLIENLPNNGTKYLLIFDDSCEEISNSKQFVKIATAGRHRGLNTIYIKHNLFHQSKLGRDVELKNTDIVLFKYTHSLVHLGIALIVAQFQQNFTYQLEYRQSFWTMSTQYVSILPIFQKFSLSLRKQFILNCPKDFIQFLSECLVNLLRGELRDLRKKDVVKYRKEISELTQKRSLLHKRRIILSSTKGLQLVSIITPFVIKQLT